MRKYISVLIISSMILGFSGCASQNTVKDTETQLLDPVNEPVQTAVATVRDISNMTVYQAEVNPYIRQLSFDREGKFQEFYVTLGEKVSKGQLIAATNQESDEQKLEDLEEKLADMKTAYTRKGIDENQTLEIHNQEMLILRTEVKSLSGIDFTKKCVEIGKKDQEIRKLELQISQEAEMETFEENQLTVQIEDAGSKIGNNKIYAPYDGVIVALDDFAPGTSMDENTDVLAIADPTRYIINCEYISLYAIEKADDYYVLVNGQRYTITYQPYDKETYLALEIQNETPVSSFSVEDPDENILPGDTAVVVVEAKKKEQVLTLPNTAVYKDSISSYVYLSQNGSKVRTEIKTGVKDDLNTEILEGLKEGDVVYAAD